MQPSLAETLPPVPKPQPRVLWRMRGPSRIIVAAIHRHPAGHELIVAFEGAVDDVLETRFERLDVAALERRAEELRHLLIEKGWTPLRLP